jgi:S-DNA-T family DNA segregation ATPase FtsK/SpoIIIE
MVRGRPGGGSDAETSKLRGMANTRKRTPVRKPTARRGSTTRTRTGARSRSGAKRRGRASKRGSGFVWPALRIPTRLPELDQRQRDVLGLGLIALGIFMAYVLWGFGSAPDPGGRAGHGLAVGLGWAVGKARVLAPIALIGGGGALLLRPVWPALRPLRTGAICLSASIVLALAAGTLGVSSGATEEKGASWTSAFLQAHGGVAGEALYQGSHRLVQGVGVDILVVFLFLVGVILMTGASLASAIRATGSGVADTTRLLKAHRPRGDTSEAPQTLETPGPLQPPEPAPEELIVRATHVEAPSLDGAPAAGAEPWEADATNAESDSGESANGGSFVNDLVGDDEADHEAELEHEDSPRDAGEPDEDEPSGVTVTDPDQLTPQGRLREAVTDDPDFVWELPPADKLLARSTAEQTRPDTAGQERTATSLTEALGHFGVQAKVIGTVAGPHITRYELRLAPGTKVAKVAQLKDDLAYALAATDIRILAPIPGKQAVGVEVPNAHRRIVKLGDVFQSPPKDWSPLTVWLGKDVAGKAIGADLAKMPHLLVAGTTGAGKSGAINAMLSSVLLRATPHEVRLVLVDPKQVELNHYESIPHLLTPVITSPRMAANALQNLVREMEQRYGIMSMARSRSLIELNKTRAKRGEAPLPYILCVIDELADLMMVAPADVEDSIIRLAQKARAVGIHLVLATQSPRVDVITGMIKANVPSRIAFAVSSQTDSRVILDQNGAESLLGQGDMLFSPVGTSRLQRIQGAYIDEGQIAKLTDLWRKQGEPELREELLEEVEPSEPEAKPDEFDPDEDPMLRDAIALVAEMQTASTSMLQRRLRLGYTRAGRVIDMLERRGVISGYEGSKPRQVLITEADLPRILAGLESRPAATPEAIVES